MTSGATGRPQGPQEHNPAQALREQAQADSRGPKAVHTEVPLLINDDLRSVPTADHIGGAM